jgi:hypothetical protein
MDRVHAQNIGRPSARRATVGIPTGLSNRKVRLLTTLSKTSTEFG